MSEGSLLRWDHKGERWLVFHKDAYDGIIEIRAKTWGGEETMFQEIEWSTWAREGKEVPVMLEENQKIYLIGELSREQG